MVLDHKLALDLLFSADFCFHLSRSNSLTCALPKLCKIFLRVSHANGALLAVLDKECLFWTLKCTQLMALACGCIHKLPLMLAISSGFRVH